MHVGIYILVYNRYVNRNTYIVKSMHVVTKYVSHLKQNGHLERELAELRREFEERSREWELEKTELNGSLVKRNAELEAILAELQDLMDSKLGLELEIAAYRKLLEGEENKWVMLSWLYYVEFELIKYFEICIIGYLSCILKDMMCW